MSEVKVNKVTPRSGTTLTIGDSGDTTNVVGTLQNNGAALVGDISSVVAGTNLSGGGTSGAVTINLADASTSAKGASSFSSDNFAASSGAITIKDLGVATAEIQDDAVTADKLANSINAEITANTAKTTNATHSGEVTGATALTIADNIVDEANLKVSNAPVNGYMLTAQSGNTGGMTWAEAGGGAWNLLSTITASDDGRIDCSLSGSYSNYAIILSGVSPVTDNTQLQARVGTASSSNDDGSNYRYVSATSQDAGATNTYYSTSATFIKIVGDSLGNALGETCEATIFIGHDSSQRQNSTRLNILSAHTDNAGRTTTNNAAGTYTPRVAVTKINFFMSSGNINYGIFKIYGIS